jgi:hypothetical protein
MEIRALAPYCYFGLFALGQSRDLLAPVRPVCHQAAYPAIVVDYSLLLTLSVYFFNITS